MSSLEVRELSVSFGGVRAVDAVTLTAEAGKLTGLIGPNGAGKTTLLDACTGFVSARGEVRLGGERIDRSPAYRRARKGLVRTFQTLDLFDDLTVGDNVAAGTPPEGRRRWWHQLSAMPSAASPAVREALETVGLDGCAALFPGQLSQGQRSLVSLARALIAGPDVLLLDEPAAGLDSHESDELGERLAAIRDKGTTILLVEHDMGLVLGHCDHVHVLDGGRMLASGTPEQVRENPAVRAAYLGEVTEEAGRESAQ
ncbi:ABC transporter ATP-binding protein [Spirillospora sp. NPDC000708]|uniref:ATP-binding cassette domain-containing protein n=1 Tax=Actinomadura physcomitrii TaxID=2650748 RepID=A0A6I4MB38_9ACTN|nr:ABC transporter ATP-binding protein [Actinomadura physcomitrii]MWA03002.1 ATP-binding cassette domain-containing protein [Actinomadura physcomitrii]